MKQLSFLAPSSPASEKPTLDVTYWKLFVDGASRNNPGKAGVGIYLMKNDRPFEQHGFYIGIKTNNQAEYYALLLGIYYLKKYLQSDDPVLILSDSQLLVRQVTGAYKIKHPELRPLHASAMRMLAGINYDIAHVLREENSNADAMANKGIDEKISVPSELIDWLHNHDLTP